jgi:hypothetical protein
MTPQSKPTPDTINLDKWKWLREVSGLDGDRT